MKLSIVRMDVAPNGMVERTGNWRIEMMTIAKRGQSRMNLEITVLTPNHVTLVNKNRILRMLRAKILFTDFAMPHKFNLMCSKIYSSNIIRMYTFANIYRDPKSKLEKLQ